jgi:hypothetical protein
VKSPRNIKPTDVRPLTPTEVAAIIRGCGLIGQTAYERLRTRAMIPTLRYTALRIGDVAMLARDRISRDGDRWRIFLRTEKSGQPVFLPVPPDMKAALDAVPAPRGSNGESRYFFWVVVRASRMSRIPACAGPVLCFPNDARSLCPRGYLWTVSPILRPILRYVALRPAEPSRVHVLFPAVRVAGSVP